MSSNRGPVTLTGMPLPPAEDAAGSLALCMAPGSPSITPQSQPEVSASRPVYPLELLLARQALRGDAGAWIGIVRRTRHSLFVFLLSEVTGREDARDLLQETYLLAVRHLDQYRGEGTLLAWMRAIARRRVVDWIRANRPRRHGRISSRDLSWDGTTPPTLDQGELCETRDRLERALARLTDAQREVLILRSVDGLSHQEIAERLGCREGTARVLYARARGRIRAFLTAELGVRGSKPPHAVGQL